MGEDAFRVAFGVLWLAFFGVRVHFGRRIPPGLSYTRILEGRERWLFRAFALGYLAIIAYALTPWLDVGRIALASWMRWLGAVALAAGIVLFGCSHSAFFIIGLGFSLLSANWLVALLYLGTLLPMYLLRVSAEEQMMIGRFGGAYRQYMAVTGRLIPRLARR